MEELTRREALYLLHLVHKSKRWPKKHNNVEIETAELHDSEKYFLEQKLEKLT